MGSNLQRLLFAASLLVPGAANPSAQPWIQTSPDRMFEAMGLRGGLTVCEIGAGDGENTIAAARRVGPTGHVYTSELGARRLQALRAAVAASMLTNITVVEGHEDRTNFRDGACDALFMRDVYHHLTSPARMNPSIYASLKPGGRVVVVDFTPPGEEAPTPADRGRDGMHGVFAETVAAELKTAGFEIVSPSDKADRWFMVVAARADK